jgi:hypothetical protein
MSLADAEPPVPAPKTHTGDVVGALVLLAVHFLLAASLALYAPFLAMGTDACAYQACGDEHWITWAIDTAWGASALALVVDATLVCVMLARHRRAWWVPVVGCLAQVGLWVAVFQMASLAGPITQ